MSKIVKEDCKNISIYKLRDWGYFNKGQVVSGNIYWESPWKDKRDEIHFLINLTKETLIRLEYRVRDKDDEWQSVSQEYPLVKTQCNYGGERYWFVCSVCKNGVYCGKRVAKLYLGAGSPYFACRGCYGLTYASRIQGYSYTYIDLDEYEKKIKKWYYKGKMTRKYLHYIKMQEAIMKDMKNFGLL